MRCVLVAEKVRDVGTGGGSDEFCKLEGGSCSQCGGRQGASELDLWTLNTLWPGWYYSCVTAKHNSVGTTTHSVETHKIVFLDLQQNRSFIYYSADQHLTEQYIIKRRENLSSR